jgi:hypothetical protein
MFFSYLYSEAAFDYMASSNIFYAKIKICHFLGGKLGTAAPILDQISLPFMKLVL